MNTPKDSTGGRSSSTDLFGLLGRYADAGDVEAEKECYDGTTPLEVVLISAALKGLQAYSEETAAEQMADGWSGEEAADRSDKYCEVRQHLLMSWDGSNAEDYRATPKT